MASAFRYVCGGCARAIVAWSDGNPYYLDAAGQKQYAYHPNHDRLALCIGNDSPHLCLKCGTEFMVDSRMPRSGCPRCGKTKIVDTCDLEGRPCPFCHRGTFSADEDFLCIS